MRFHEPQVLKTIAKIINAKIIGDENFQVLGTNEIHRVKEGEIVFVNHPKYYEKALNSSASIILIDQEVDCPQGKHLLVSDDPFRDFNKINTYFVSQINFENKIGKNTEIHPTAIVGKNVIIGENCLIGPNVFIGERTVVGNNCIVQAGTVLGGDAFYYRKTQQGFDRLISVGHVVLEDDVEVGVNCTIDRGVTDVTLIGHGTKLDNLIQVGHDTIIGKNCLIAAQAGIAGCCTIEDEVTIWGQVGIVAGKTIGKGASILGQTGVNRDLESGKSYFGPIAQEFREYLKKEVLIKRKLAE